MAYDPAKQWQPEDDSVTNRVTGLMSKQNPLMQQAATQGAQASNRRGLLNSSMGVQAGQTAAYGVALPIASQEAGQAHQRNLQGRDFQHQYGMQGSDQSHQRDMQGRDIDFRREAQTNDIENQRHIAGLNASVNERAGAASLAAQFENSYATVVANIMNNPDIPAETRQQYLDHAGRVRDSNLRLVEQFYGVKLDWGAPPAGSQLPPGTGPAPVAGGGSAPQTQPQAQPRRGRLRQTEEERARMGI